MAFADLRHGYVQLYNEGVNKRAAEDLAISVRQTGVLGKPGNVSEWTIGMFGTY